MEEEKVKISELEATNTINDEDILPIVQSGVTKKVTTANLLSDVYNTIEEVVDKEAYSTNEILTNKVWINNKPIYRKVLTGTLPNGSGENTFTFNNIEILNFYGKIKSTSGASFLINTYYTPLPAYSISGWIDNSGNLKIECGTNYNTSSEYKIALEYTKTTD